MSNVEVQVEVTADDIGTPGVWDGDDAGGRCMLDRAYDHTFQPGTVRQMFSSAYRVGKKGLVELPEEARQMVWAWDTRQKVEPFTFTLSVPEEWMEDLMSKLNRIFPLWKKGKKNERPPGSHPPKPPGAHLRPPRPPVPPADREVA